MKVAQKIIFFFITLFIFLSCDSELNPDTSTKDIETKIIEYFPASDEIVNSTSTITITFNKKMDLTYLENNITLTLTSSSETINLIFNLEKNRTKLVISSENNNLPAGKYLATANLPYYNLNFEWNFTIQASNSTQTELSLANRIELTPTIADENFGYPVCMDGDTIAVAGNKCIYIFDKTNETFSKNFIKEEIKNIPSWEQTAKIDLPEYGDTLLQSINLSGNYIIYSISYNTYYNDNKIYISHRENNQWTLETPNGLETGNVSFLFEDYLISCHLGISSSTALVM